MKMNLQDTLIKAIPITFAAGILLLIVTMITSAIAGIIPSLGTAATLLFALIFLGIAVDMHKGREGITDILTTVLAVGFIGSLIAMIPAVAGIIPAFAFSISSAVMLAISIAVILLAKAVVDKFM